ncbi:MAG: hypothetical protein KatS3mg118_3221 [Paracoccaceae bacterium]|nr:MAG: hypothetical protein KatS3mg118_3221 [Paracoccaceae bacterium]
MSKPDTEIRTAALPHRHALTTRLLHMGVALAVIWQLGVSLIMQGPRGPQAGDLFFATHSYVGLAAMAVIVLFWANLALRRVGTAHGALFPWFSAERRAALWADTRAHLAALTRLRLPHYDENAPLASAVHGLGLLLMTLMAATGTLWWFAAPSAAAGAFEIVHKLFANLAWAYLIGHAGLAVIHHLRGEASLSEMWSLRGRN